MEDLEYVGLGAFMGGVLLVVGLLQLQNHNIYIFELEAKVARQERALLQKSAADYRTDMDPDMPSWNRIKKTKEATTQPQ